MRVLYVQYTNPGAYPPLVRGAQLVAESGAEVLMLGTRVRGTDALEVPPARGVTVRLMPEAADGWRLKAHYARYAAWVAREAVSWKPDWIYASDLMSAPVAVGLAVGGARVVYHEHDAPTHDHESWFVRRCLEARLRLLRTAAVVVAPNAARAARLSELAGGRESLTVWNCPRRPVARADRPPQADTLRVIYRGSVNSDRLPLTTIDALARANGRVSLEIAGYETAGSRGYLAALARCAEQFGIGARVRLAGTLSDADLSPICAECDLGLALMPVASRDENMRDMTGASNKVFEYLASGVTPLVSDLPDWRRTFVDAGYALSCDPRDAGSLAAAFDWALGHRAELRAIADRGWERLQADWNYEAQFAPVLDAMWGNGSPSVRTAATPAPNAHGETVAEVECAS